MSTPICPKCGKEATRKENWQWNTWECKPCDTRIGCHKGTWKPLGTMADLELRNLRIQVHKLIDPYWKETRLRRKDVYMLLGNLMGLSEEEAHIGRFDKDQCKFVLENWTKKHPW